MKKFITGVLSLSMLMAFGSYGMAAAPEISGSAEISVIEGREDEVEAEVVLGGKLDKGYEYTVGVECNTEDNGDTATSFSEISLSKMGEVFGVKFGKFAYNPTIMDMLDEDSMLEMNSEALIQFMVQTGKLSAAAAYQICETLAENGFDEGAFQVEVDYSLLDNCTIGVNYQDRNDDTDAGLTFQFEFLPADWITLYGEVGNPTGSDDTQTLAGLLTTYKDLSLRFEYNSESEEWAGKVAYQLAEALSVQYQHNSDSANKFSVAYEF